MKRIILATIVLITLIGVAIAINHKPVKHTIVPVKPVATPVQVTHGVKPPYNDCVPDETGSAERKHQQEIIDMAKAIQQEEKVTNGQISTGLTALNQKYSDLIAKYDTCTLVEN